MPGERRTPNESRADLGAFVLDPESYEFRALKPLCEQGNPWRCLIATAGAIHLGRRMTVKVDHEKRTGVIGITEGDFRWERPMTQQELKFAIDFDMSNPLTRRLTVRVNLRDSAWRAKFKQARARDDGSKGGAKTPENNQGRGKRNPTIKTIRARQLRAIRDASQRQQLLDSMIAEQESGRLVAETAPSGQLSLLERMVNFQEEQKRGGKS